MSFDVRAVEVIVPAVFAMVTRVVPVVQGAGCLIVVPALRVSRVSPEAG